MSHFALGSVGFCHVRSAHCSELSPSGESLLRHKLRCSFPSLTVFTVIKPWKREWSKRVPCHEPDGGHRLLTGAREVHATTVRITKEQGNRLGAPWRLSLNARW